jgi:hypothetical protein
MNIKMHVKWIYIRMRRLVRISGGDSNGSGTGEE